MSLTAVVTSHNYGRYLTQCLDSAWKYCDEILIFDDASTDDSCDIVRKWAAYHTDPLIGKPNPQPLSDIEVWVEDEGRYASWRLARGRRTIKLITRPDNTGDPIWGSNLGIEMATSTHLIFLDADNYLINQPPLHDVDYCFAPIVAFEDGKHNGVVWRFEEFPTDAKLAYERFQRSDPPIMPFPWGGVWRTAFLKPLRWTPWKTTKFAQDMNFCLTCVKRNPTLEYWPRQFLAFRKHPAQFSEHPDRDVMYAEARTRQSEPFEES